MNQNNNPRNSHHFLILIISITILFSFINLPLCSPSCNPTHNNALLQVKAEWDHPLSFEPWNSTSDCCNHWWAYRHAYVIIYCNDHGDVINLLIDSPDDVTGQLPAALGDLTSLQSLTLYNMPNLLGPIPSAICRLTNLRFLKISKTGLTGPIPDCLGRFKNLTHLELSNSGLSGRVPPTLAQLPNLHELSLHGNHLVGPIPDFPVQTSNIYKISLYKNQLSGSILPSLGFLPNLQYLDLSSNRFTGSIPQSFGSLPNSAYLSLQNNSLTGPVPDSLGRVHATILDLSNNKLSGDVSFLFGKNKPLTQIIKLENNFFKFDISNLELPERLMVLNISNNEIYGSLPYKLCELSDVDVSYNQLCGLIPSGCHRFESTLFANNKCLYSYISYD